MVIWKEHEKTVNILWDITKIAEKKKNKNK